MYDAIIQQINHRRQVKEENSIYPGGEDESFEEELIDYHNANELTASESHNRYNDVRFSLLKGIQNQYH